MLGHIVVFAFPNGEPPNESVSRWPNLQPPSAKPQTTASNVTQNAPIRPVVLNAGLGIKPSITLKNTCCLQAIKTKEGINNTDITKHILLCSVHCYFWYVFVDIIN
jgi:hypothetical protein